MRFLTPLLRGVVVNTTVKGWVPGARSSAPLHVRAITSPHPPAPAPQTRVGRRKRAVEADGGAQKDGGEAVGREDVLAELEKWAALFMEVRLLMNQYC